MKPRKPIILAAIVVWFIISVCGITQPTSKVEPTPTPIPGWEKFTAQGIEIWFPETFEGGDLQNDLDVIVEKLKALGPEFEAIANAIEANPSTFVLWVFNSKLGDTGYLTNVNITTEKIFSSMTLDTYIEAFSKQIPSSMEITDQQKVMLNQYEAARLVVEMDVNGLIAKELVYVIKDKNTIWAITYATSAAEYDTLLPIFEQSALTFKAQS